MLWVNVFNSSFFKTNINSNATILRLRKLLDLS